MTKPQTAMLTPSTKLPMVFSTIQGDTVTIVARLTLNGLDRYIGVIASQSNGYNYASLWNSDGLKVYGDNSSGLHCPDNLACKYNKTRQDFISLCEADRQILVGVYAASVKNKIHGIKTIRKLTGWGLTEAKYAHEHLLPSVIGDYSLNQQ